MNGTEIRNQRKAPMSQFAGIGQNGHLRRALNHPTVQLGFHNVQRGQAYVRVQADRAHKAMIGMEGVHDFFRLRPDESRRRVPEKPSQHDEREVGQLRQFGCDIQRIRNNSYVFWTIPPDLIRELGQR